MTGQERPEDVPPHNLDAERELLGSLLAYYTVEVAASITETPLQSTDFYWRPHEIVYRAIVALHNERTHVDVLTVARFLGRTRSASGSFLDAVGGEALLHVLASHAVPHGVKERAVMVAEDGEWRRRLREAQEKMAACYVRDQAAYDAAGGEQPRLKLVS